MIIKARKGYRALLGSNVDDLFMAPGRHPFMETARRNNRPLVTIAGFPQRALIQPSGLGVEGLPFGIGAHPLPGGFRFDQQRPDRIFQMPALMVLINNLAVASRRNITTGFG